MLENAHSVVRDLDVEQEIEGMLIRLKFIIFRNILINLYSSLIWLAL